MQSQTLSYSESIPKEKREACFQHIIGIRKMLTSQKNIAQETFDESTPTMRKLICFHAGLKSRHINMRFFELAHSERIKVIEALNSLIEFGNALPAFISETDSVLDIEH
jgi:uncharacterized circularly permuted ATP-grasp superfamily protein